MSHGFIYAQIMNILLSDYEQVWVNAADDPPTREKKMISAKKVMITVVWRPSGVLLIVD